MQPRTRTVSTAFAALAIAGAAGAVPIELSHQGRLIDGAPNAISGEIDGVAFTASGFTITGIADAEAVESEASAILGPDTLFLDHLSATITIDGVGVFNLSTQTFTALSTTQSLYAFSAIDHDDPFELTGITDRPFQERDLSVGSQRGWNSGDLAQGLTLETDAGLLTFNGGAIETRIAITPAPPAAALFGLAALTAGRRRRAASA